MKTCIVGHGPSMLTGKFGYLIDRFDRVVRLKRCQETLKHPSYYGTKTDVVCGSWTIAPQLKGIGGAREHWVFLDSRHKNVTDRDIDNLEAYFAPAHITIHRDLCDHWNAIYRGERTPDWTMADQVESKKTSDDKGHTHMSAGLHAILYATEEHPDEITLFGFDNVATGNFHWSVTRGPEWDKYPDHRWDVEKKIVNRIVEEYGINVNFFMPETEDIKCVL